MRNILTIALLCLWVQEACAQTCLFEHGKSVYTIVVQGDASLSEQTAANELQTYIQRVGGVRLPIQTDTGTTREQCIYVGWTQRTGAKRPADSDETYTYRTQGSNLYIYGGKDRGTMYGVYAFLERELGVHWFTSAYTQVPKLDAYTLEELNHSESPVIALRLNFYNDALRHHDWIAHNLLNEQHTIPPVKKYGRVKVYWGIHTFQTLIPAEKYFKQHPEYFSVYKGRRSDKAQLCLSNENMRHELTENLLNIIKEKPGYWCYDVSQNDNSNPCECGACELLVRKYGGQSGAMIWFVNQVAKEVKRVYPNVCIGTFAYRYTRQAPTSSIRPADNVVVRLCDIECCMAHPLEGGCEQNRSFVSDMNDWKRKTKNIYIWDYTTGFRNYLLPFPNFDVLAENYQYFSRSNVIGIMEEGAHDAPWNEFSELKQWLIAKLMWNPYQSVDSLASVFINGYYGAAAPYIKMYYDLCQKQITDDVHFTIKIDWNSELYDDAFVNEGIELMNKAIAAAKGRGTEKRVKRIAAQLYYLKLRRNVAASATDGTLQQFCDIIKGDSTIMREFNYPLNKLLKDIGYQ